MPSLSKSFVLARRVVGQAGVFALAQLVILLIWSRAGMMISAFILIDENHWTTLAEFLGHRFGSRLHFCRADFRHRRVLVADDRRPRCRHDHRLRVQRERGAAQQDDMILWGSIIAVLTAIGFATAFLGLAIIMPWLAYSAWHAYSETLDASGWPALD